MRPSGIYNGQKLTKLVNKNTPASTRRTMPSVPLMVLVKKSMAITAAIRVRIVLSVFPMFFFIILRLVT